MNYFSDNLRIILIFHLSRRLPDNYSRTQTDHMLKIIHLPYVLQTEEYQVSVSFVERPGIISIKSGR